MHLSDFDFILPERLIAQTPAEPRDSAKLLVVDRKSGNISHHRVADLPDLIAPNTHLVANNSRVRKARLYSQENREFLIVEHITEGKYRALSRGKEPKPGDSFSFGNADTSWSATVIDIERGESMSTVVIDFSLSHAEAEKVIEHLGHMPLPPYITERGQSDERYQTVYAGPTGSAAAPTAGLHITPELITKLTARHHTWDTVTLHVGLGTFLPLRKETIEENTLHTETTYINQHTAERITNTIAENKPLLAIGTTSLRTLQGHWDEEIRVVKDGMQETNIFIQPGQSIQTANSLLTNFHLPKSSLVVLVASFLGNHSDRTPPIASAKEMVEFAQHVYSEAIANEYRFYSFGDAMLIN